VRFKPLAVSVAHPNLELDGIDTIRSVIRECEPDYFPRITIPTADRTGVIGSRRSPRVACTV
jgi:hypothetical protein